MAAQDGILLCMAFDAKLLEFRPVDWNKLLQNDEKAQLKLAKKLKKDKKEKDKQAGASDVDTDDTNKAGCSEDVPETVLYPRRLPFNVWSRSYGTRATGINKHHASLGRDLIACLREPWGPWGPEHITKKLTINTPTRAYPPMNPPY